MEWAAALVVMVLMCALLNHVLPHPPSAPAPAAVGGATRRTAWSAHRR